MASQRPESGEAAVDELESTAKLPVLDVAAFDELDVEDESHLRTTVLPPDAFHTSDTHPGIPILKEPPGFSEVDARVVVHAAAAAPALDAAAAAAGGERALAEAEAAIGQLLERQADLLRDMRDVRAEAEARYERLESDLDAARRLGEDLDAMRREAEARSLAAEQRAVALETEFAAARDKLEAELAALRRQHEAELATTRRQGESELAAARQQAEADLAEALRRQAQELDTLRQEQGAAIAALQARHDDEGATLRAQSEAAHDEVAQLGRELAGLRGLRSADEAALAQARDEIARLGLALDEVRASLADGEQRAGQSLAERSREVELVRGELAGLRALAATQAEALQVAESRRGIWASLLGDAESAHEAQLREARAAADAERARAAAAAQAELQEGTRRQGELEATLRVELQAAAARLAELEAQLADSRERAREAASQAEAAVAQGAEWERRMQALQARFDDAEAASRAASVGSIDSQQSADEQAEAMRTLQAELRRNAERVSELESDLRAAEDQVNRLEGELRSKSSRLEELGRAGWPGNLPAEAPQGATRRRDDFAARGRALADGGTGADSVLPADSAFSGAGAAASADGVTRYFVLMDGDTEIVHVLGRRTTIGRGLDNDVRIDTKFISRHHAVVLAGPNQTVVEDLRSTNGVLVNGRRVTRSVLRDGDIVHVGKTQFRFVQRSRER